MASPPPAYGTSASPGASSVDTDQTTHPWPTPTALLPSYSTSSPLCWMKEEALEILRTSHDFDAIRLICKFVPGLDPAVAAALLSERRKGWLNAFLKVLCRRQAVQEPPCDSLLSTAKAIVGIIRRRLLSPAPEWNGAWIFSALNSSIDISTIAEKLDAQIHSVSSRIAFEDWLAWSYGYSNDPIQSLLNTVFNFRNDLAQSVQKHATMVDRLQLLQKVLPSRHPLPHWIVSTAIASDTSSEPSEALRFFVDPIKQRGEEQSCGILSVVRRFSILNTRYELHITSATDVKWPKPFSTCFLFWESVQRESPLDLAKSNTESVSKLYSRLAVEDVLDDTECLKRIERRWSNLSTDIQACLVVDENLAIYFIELADHLLDLRNVHSAAAIGLALERWGYRLQNATQSRVWDIINPKDNYAGCRKFMAENVPCLPLLFLSVAELRRSKNAASKIMALFQFQAYFGRQKEEVEHNVEKGAIREGTTVVNRNTSNYLPSSSPARRLKRKAVQNLNPEDGQQNNLNTKRRKLEDNPCKLQSPLILEGPIGRGREIWVIHGNLTTEPNGHSENPKNVNMSAGMLAHYIAFREENADEIRALCIKKNCQIFKEACQQMERILVEVADAPAVALEILSGLTRTQMALLSCATIAAGQCFHDVVNGVDSREWTDEEKAAFTHKFTSFVAGRWDEERVLNDWNKLAKVLVDEAWERRRGKPPATKGYLSVWAGIEIWSKLDGFQRHTQVLRLELASEVRSGSATGHQQ